MTINSFDRKMFHQAYVEATKSTFNRFHVGAVITYKNRIIGRGHNSAKTHPMQQAYNKRYRKFNNSDTGDFVRHSVHAEIAALCSVPYCIGRDIDWTKVNVYVFRICPGRRRGYGNSKPCPACTAALKDYGVKNVYFTSNEGLAYVELD